MTRSSRHRLLVINEDGDSLDVLRALEGEFTITCLTDPPEALAALETERFDVALADLQFEDYDGVELCRGIVAADPRLPVIVMASGGSVERAVAAIRAGAYDFLPKPLELDRLVLTLERALKHRSLGDEVERLRQLAVPEAGPSEEILGESPQIRGLCQLVERVATTDAAVLIIGETGTGKELVARAIHRLSARRAGPWVAINCAAVPEPLLESELFGHAKGAFTGAGGSRVGLMQHACGGTLFLDEVAEMPLSLQVKLLRALQEQRVRPVGSDVEVPIDVRIVSATNVDLEEAVAEGRFREELMYRIQVIRIDVPPLRRRGNDVLLLAQRFLDRYAQRCKKPVRGMSRAFAERILGYDWPGNVRELSNCMERAVALTLHDELALEDLPTKIRQFQEASHLVPTEEMVRFVPLKQFERHYILRVLEAVGGNKARAARILGLNRKTLYRKLDQYTAESGRFRALPTGGESERVRRSASGRLLRPPPANAR